MNIEMMQLITTYATVSIALLAFFLSVWQFFASRNHNRLSVTPLLTYEIQSVRTERGFGIYLLNNGVGPAIVKDFRIFVDATEVVAKPSEMWPKAVKQLNISYTFVQILSIGRDAPVSSGQRIALLTVDDNIEEEKEDRFREALPRIDIELRYESVYKQKYVARLRDA